MNEELMIIDDLQKKLVDELDKRFVHGLSRNRPGCPLVIIYADDEALNSKEEIDETLWQVWGEYSRYITQYKINGDGFVNVSSGEARTRDDTLKEILEMFGLSTPVFDELSHLSICYIQNAKGYETLDAFVDAYGSVKTLREDMKINGTSTDIVMLDEGPGAKAVADEIRDYLRERMKEKDSKFDSTILLSNRLSGGGFVVNERVRENNLLAAWILVLMNGVDDVYTPDMSIWSPADKESYITASFSQVCKPVDEIIFGTLSGVFSWLNDNIQHVAKTMPLSVTDLSSRFEISGGKMRFIEEYFDGEIRQMLPVKDAFRYLPRKQPDTGTGAERSVISFDEFTMGGYNAFLKLVTESTSLKSAIGTFEDRFREYLHRVLSRADCKASITPGNVRELEKQIKPADDPRGKDIETHAINQIHDDFIRQILPIFERVLIDEQKNAGEQVEVFEKVWMDFGRRFRGQRQDINEYYSDMVTGILNNTSLGMGENLKQAVNMNGGNYDGLVDVIYDIVKRIIDERDIYQKPLEEEMASRWNNDPNEVHKQIQKMLFGDIDKKIRFRTAFSLSKIYQVIVVNERNINGVETDLFKRIKSDPSVDKLTAYFDSGNKNSLEVIQLYRVDENSLLS